MQYREMSEQVIDHFGGVENISQVEHCTTRLRIHFVDKTKVDLDALKGIEKVISVVEAPNQIQVVIGPNVEEAFEDFLAVSGEKGGIATGSVVDEDPDGAGKPRSFKDLVTIVGNACAGIFVPISPALITGGVILSIKNLLVNYFGMGVESGTAQVMLAIFSAGFTYFPIYIGFYMCQQLKLQPVLGAMLGALLVSLSGVEGLDFFGLPIPVVEYGGSVLPVVLGVALMYYVDKVVNRILPDSLRFFMRPLLVMTIVCPITLLWIGPLGTLLSTAVGNGVVAIMNAAGWLALPLISAVYPYMVMLGLDKAMNPIMIQSIASVGYDPVVMVVGFVSNLAIAGTTLALAARQKNRESRGMIGSLGVTALCGVTEPAFYGALVERPRCLMGTAVGALVAGLVAGVFGLKNYIAGGCPALLTLLYFVPNDGAIGFNFFLSLIVAALSVSISFIATTIVLRRYDIR